MKMESFAFLAWFLIEILVPFQMVNLSRLKEADSPIMLVYFVEDQNGERLSAAKASDLINRVDIQKAAIILGYRIQGPVAQRKSPNK